MQKVRKLLFLLQGIRLRFLLPAKQSGMAKECCQSLITNHSKFHCRRSDRVRVEEILVVTGRSKRFD